MSNTYQSIDTKLIHAGEPHPRLDGAVSLPIYQSATYEFNGSLENETVRYIR